MAQQETIRIPAYYVPRPEQIEFWKAYHSGIRFFDLCWHRREGKDFTALNATVEEILTKRPGLAWHLFPTLAQGRKVLWDATDNQGRPLTSAFPKQLVTEVNKADMRIKCKYVPDIVEGRKEVRESTWQIVGADNPDSLRGANPVIVVISEFGDIPPNLWYEIIQPILFANGGKAIFVWTPKGRNHAYTLHCAAKESMNDPDVPPEFKWFSQELTVDDTHKWVYENGEEAGIPSQELIDSGKVKCVPVVSQEAVEEARKQGMDEAVLQQEFYCMPGNALVATVSGQSPIEEIREGDYVLTHTGAYREVTKTYSRYYTAPLYEIHCSNMDTPLQITPNHPIYVYNENTLQYEWKQAGNIEYGDKIATPTTPCIVEDVIVHPNYKGMVYNISVANDESYVANGRVVHNCSFNAALKGAYFGDQMNEAVRDGRINNNILHNPSYPVYTGWDLGMNDTMDIVFAQIIDDQIKIIDFYENNGKGLEHYIQYINSKPYTYAYHFGPHDLKVRELGAGSRLEFARKLGLRFTVIPRVSAKEDSINAARAILNRCFFNMTKCSYLIESLKCYTKKWDEKRQVYLDTPLHNAYSNSVDAFQTLAMGLSSYPQAMKKMKMRETEDGYLLEKVDNSRGDDRYDLYNYDRY